MEPLKSICRFSAVLVIASSAVAMMVTPLLSDPCGMVPPIYTGPGTPISRTGLQQTYVFYDDGVESFVIRPGFEGKVDNFGMLIPFPTAPALRKVPDSVFDQIAAGVDPPEVVIDLMPVLQQADAMDFGAGVGGGGLQFRRKVNVIKQEAVGMYEVAVLEAGSADALKRWMDQNQYQYPKGMDDVCEDYISEGWCFVAVKTKVGNKSEADPQPGQRNIRPDLPSGSVFDGNVQGLGFRFRTDKLVVPMRLSAFNEGELRNVVYLLTRNGKKIRSIPEEYVVRQIPGPQLIKNLTDPLPVRLIAPPGQPLEIPKWRRGNLAKERNPEPHNGVAKQLFVSDIRATSDQDLSLDHEELEKELLRVGEHLGLRGIEFDRQIEDLSKRKSARELSANLPKLKDFTLTVVDGDFPRQVIAEQNLTFADFRMPASKNTPSAYDAQLHGPRNKRAGRLISHWFDNSTSQPVNTQIAQVLAGDAVLNESMLAANDKFSAAHQIKQTSERQPASAPLWAGGLGLALLTVMLVTRQKQRGH